jgi:hypothetical protein
MTLRNAFADLAQEHVTPSGAHLVGNARTKFRDGFAATGITQPDPAVWVLENDDPANLAAGTEGHIINQGGDAYGSSYLRISLSPFLDDSRVTLTSKEKFRFPTRIGWGVTSSQRVLGQEVFFGLVEADDTDPLGIKRTVDPGAARPITANGGVTSNVLTVTAPGHGFRTGDRVYLVNCPDTRMNVGPVTATVTGADSFTVPVVIANGTYTTTGGEVRHADPLSRADNAVGLLLENTTVTNASFAARRNKAKYRLRNSTIASTANTQGTTSGWADSFLTTGVHELFCSLDECLYKSFTADGNSSQSGGDKYHQGIPDEELSYRLHIRARNLDGLSKPIARITSIAKAGSTTATVTTDVPHGLTVNSRVGIYGVRDQTNYPNSSDLPVASVPSATTFTVVIGPSATVTDTNGGVVFINHGLVNSPGAFNFAVQSIARDTNGIVTVVANANWSGHVPGEYVHLWGMNGAGAAVHEGAYRVLSASTTSLYLEPAGGRVTGNAVATITTGGALIRRTDVRLHFARVLDYTRMLAEIVGGRGSTSDGNNAVPVTIASGATTGTPSIAASSSVTGTTIAKVLAAASVNNTLVKSSAGRLYGYHLANPTTSWRYVKLYNKATAPVAGTDTPAATISLPPGGSVELHHTVPLSFGTGIGYAITANPADLDATAVAANDVVGHLLYL